MYSCEHKMFFRSSDQSQMFFSCDQAALWMVQSVCLSVCPSVCHTPGGGTRSENWWGCAAGRWKLDPKRSREKWNLGPKRSNSLRIGSFNTPKDRFGVGGWEKIPQKDRARSCQSEKRGSKPRHICITHHIGSTPPGSHLFDYVPIIASSWNFQELLPMTEVTFMQKVMVKGQGHRGQHPT